VSSASAGLGGSPSLALEPSGRIGWTLPGHGETLRSCGEPSYRVHRAENGESHWRSHHSDCARFECPTCHGWAVRESGSVAHRVKEGARIAKWKPAHFVLSPPPEVWSLTETVEGMRALRTKAYKVAKARGIRGGAVFFHPVRLNSPRWGGKGCVHPGPHFHVLGDGWLDHSEVARGHVRDGWIVKGLGVRKSVRETALYLLSHAGKAVLTEPVSLSGNPALEEPTERRSPLETVTWFGTLSYNQLRGVKPPVEGLFCKVCEAKVPLKDWMTASWVGQGPPPEGYGVMNRTEWRAFTLDRTGRWLGEVVRVEL
jgi:hypothetical protein